MLFVPRRYSGIILILLLTRATSFVVNHPHQSDSLGPSTQKATVPPTGTDIIYDDFDGNWIGDQHLQEDQSLRPSGMMYAALAERQSQLYNGIGKRFVCHTLKSPLKVYREPLTKAPDDSVEGDDDSNVVGVLREGQIVTSIGARFGPWIRHDGGGWSLSTERGKRWLHPVNE